MPVDAAAVAQFLTDSKAAHLAYRYALTQNQFSEAKIQIAKAADYRAQAHAADVEHTAPTWADNEHNYPHAALTAFYLKELAK